MWEYPKGWERLENLLDATWEIDVPEGNPMPMPLRLAITRTWIEWARIHGDPTASQFIDGSETFGVTDTITYHDNKIEPKVNPPITYRPWEKEGAEATEIQRLPND